MCSFEETVKRRLHPLDAFPRLLNCVSANRPPDEEDRFRFEWFGLFYQAPEQDAFTLRLRLPGGRLKPFQLAGLAEITQEHACGEIRFNALGGLDVPGVPLASAITILHEVEGIGLSARGTGGDCVQTVRGGEDDGFGPAGDGGPIYPLVRALEHALSCRTVYSDLPRPCGIIFQTAGEAFVDNGWSIDTLILRATAGDGGRAGENQQRDSVPCFLLTLPGEPKSGWVLAREDVVPGCLELLENWALHADRSSRKNASLAEFLAGLDLEAIPGLPRNARRVLLPAGPRPSTSSGSAGDPRAGFAVLGGRLLSGQLTALARSCREQTWHEIRLARGCLHPVENDGMKADAGMVLALASSG